MGKGFKALIFGGAIGAAIGILYAPRSGKKTREMIAEKTDAVINSPAFEDNKIFGEVAKTTKNAVEAGQNFINAAQNTKFAEFTKGATEKGQKIFKDTTNFVGEFANENVRPIFSEKNDELRKKIENARSKIANQVATNIDNDSQPAPIQATSKKKVVKKVTRKPAVKKPAAKKVSTKKVTKPAKKTTAASKKSAVKKSSSSKKPAAKKTASKTTSRATKTSTRKTARKSK